ncbi:ankyrin repeats (3 copies) domain-containing protein [Ditylenchus destructor]|nr:ankyrin repeats (3 copies) domain-containing protein [Ditylenchus destructor]
MIVYVCLWVISLCIVSSAPAKKEDSPDLIKALNDGKFEHALSLAKEGTGINAKDGKGLTPLLLALNIIMDVKERLSNLVNALNDEKYDRALSLAKVILAAKEELPDLIDALNDKKYDLALSLAKEGVGIKAKNKNDATPLYLAIKNINYSSKGMKTSEKEELVKALLESGADANAKAGDYYNGATPLLYAAEYGTDKMAEELLKHGAKVDGKDRSGYTPLMEAARNGKTEMAKMFMDAGANVLAKTKSGDGVLNWAAFSGDNELVEIFLAKGADPTLMDLFTPLMNAASGNHENVVKTLLKDERVRKTINLELIPRTGFQTRRGGTAERKSRMFNMFNEANVAPRSEVGNVSLWNPTLTFEPSLIRRNPFWPKCVGLERVSD